MQFGVVITLQLTPLWQDEMDDRAGMGAYPTEKRSSPDSTVLQLKFYGLMIAGSKPVLRGD